MLLALLAGTLVIRSAAVESFASTRPDLATKAWPSHPDVVLQSGLTAVGDAAAAGHPVPEALVRELIAASAKAPLAPEPFLVRAVQADVSGELRTAEQSLIAARALNPRFVPTRYFVASHYLKTGDAKRGLAEISALARLVPQSLPNIAPFLAAYAKTPGSAEHLKMLIREQPVLETVLLGELAKSGENSDLILGFWSGRGGEGAGNWQIPLINAMIAAERYVDARRAWARFTGISVDRRQIFDPSFSTQTLPPFGWTLAAGSSGVAEPEGGGKLHVLYYGRDRLVLASQVMTLPPARYNLSMRIAGPSQSVDSLVWTIRCLPSRNELASLRISTRGGDQSVQFSVPATCAAQVIELAGTAADIPQQADVIISHLALSPVRQ